MHLLKKCCSAQYASKRARKWLAGTKMQTQKCDRFFKPLGNVPTPRSVKAVRIPGKFLTLLFTLFSGGKPPAGTLSGRNRNACGNGLLFPLQRQREKLLLAGKILQQIPTVKNTMPKSNSGVHENATKHLKKLLHFMLAKQTYSTRRSTPHGAFTNATRP